MKNLNSTALKIVNGEICILNQQALPQKEEWLTSASIDDMCDIIKMLKVRGAPLIGVSAALALAQYAEQGADQTALFQAADQLKAARPTAVNLSYCVDRLLATYEQSGATGLITEAETIFEEDAILCEKIAGNGATFIQPGDRILTHCNTGGLVTTGIGTALGIIIQAHREQKQPHVYVDETRPLLQGGRLTAWECVQNNISHEIICDNMAASLMYAKKIDKIFLGADRIAANGDFANKIGTYNLAVLAHYHNIPFYVAAPYTTVDSNCPTGDEIAIEYRNAAEVKGASGSFGHVTWSPEASPAYNPAFDVTPAELVTAFILDSGILSGKDFEQAIKKEKRKGKENPLPFVKI